MSSLDGIQKESSVSLLINDSFKEEKKKKRPGKLPPIPLKKAVRLNHIVKLQKL